MDDCFDDEDGYIYDEDDSFFENDEYVYSDVNSDKERQYGAPKRCFDMLQNRYVWGSLLILFIIFSVSLVSSRKTTLSAPIFNHLSSGSDTVSLTPKATVPITTLIQQQRQASPQRTFKLPRYPTTPDAKCQGPYPGYPDCSEKIVWLQSNWNKDSDKEEYYRLKGVDGSKCSFLNYWNNNGLVCPEAADAKAAKIRGVNLGGWLVLEPWITPSLFEQFDESDKVVDEWTFCKVLGHSEARRQLTIHWETWLQEDDLAKLASSGITHIRIPVGYWIMGSIEKWAGTGEPWVDGGLVYLRRAILWAERYSLKVVIDLHSLPGSQNGFDNSGRQGSIEWASPTMDKDGQETYPHIQRSLDVIEKIVQEFSEHPFHSTVVAIELANEIFSSVDFNLVQKFYQDGYKRVKDVSEEMAVIIGDSFRLSSFDQTFMQPPEYKNVWLDTHVYDIFDEDGLKRSKDEHLTNTCTQTRNRVSHVPITTLVGEFSLATTDCAKWLNGYGQGSRYDGTYKDASTEDNTGDATSVIGSCEGLHDIRSQAFSKDHRQFLRQFFDKQIDAYETGSAEGWFFWNFKTEMAPEWSYLEGLKQGWIPRTLDPSSRQYSCSTQEDQDTSVGALAGDD